MIAVVADDSAPRERWVELAEGLGGVVVPDLAVAITACTKPGDVVVVGSLASAWRGAEALLRRLATWREMGVGLVAIADGLDTRDEGHAAALEWVGRLVDALARGKSRAARPAEVVKASVAPIEPPNRYAKTRKTSRRRPAARVRLPKLAVHPREIAAAYHRGLSVREATAWLRNLGVPISPRSYRRRLTELVAAGEVDEAKRATALEARGGVPRRGKSRR